MAQSSKMKSYGSLGGVDVIFIDKTLTLSLSLSIARTNTGLLLL